MNPRIFSGIAVAFTTAACYTIGYAICQALSVNPENFFFAGMMSGLTSMWLSTGIYESIGEGD